MANFGAQSETFWDPKISKNLQKCQKWSKVAKKLKKVNFWSIIFRQNENEIFLDFWDFWWFLWIFGIFWDPKRAYLYIGFLFLVFFWKKKWKKMKKMDYQWYFYVCFFVFFVKFFEKNKKKVDFLSNFGALFGPKTG